MQIWFLQQRVSALVLVIIVLGLSAGCGFAPIYGRGADVVSANLAQQLGAVEVQDIPNRVGRQLRLKLQRDLAVAGRAVNAKYALKVELSASRTPLLIQSDDTVTRFNLRLEAIFFLVDIATSENLFRGDAQSIGSYNVVDSEFATMAAERDSEDRAAGDLGVEIHSLLVAYFSRVDS